MGSQNAVPIRTMGNIDSLRVWIRMAISNASSSVPKPPGMTTNAQEYLTSITFLTKKCSNFT